MLYVLSVVATNRVVLRLPRRRVYPGRPTRKRIAPACALAAAGVAIVGTGCGGGGESKTAAVEAQQVRGSAFVFSAPTGWAATRSARGAVIRRGSGPELASVTVLALRRRYRPALFAETARGLDRITRVLAAKLNGKVIASRTVVVGGIRSRQYDVAYSRAGVGLIDRITYVLRGKAEYYLLCRWPAETGTTEACGLLTRSFRVR
jgi:hypothetical protein